MSFEFEKNGNIIDLEPYLDDNPGPVSPCDDEFEPKWWRLTPYGLIETLKWILKMLVLPGAIAAIIIITTLLGTGRFESLTIGIVYTVLTYIGTVLVYIYVREQTLTNYHSIQDEEILASETLNELEEKRLKIGFVGDIMMMRKYKLIFSDEVKAFFNDVDIVLGNLEGIVTDSKCKVTKQAHPITKLKSYQKIILKNLQGLLGDRTTGLLCLSNNHSIDFGNKEFHESLNFIHSQEKIEVFGRNDISNVFVKGKEINIASASEWSNQKTWNCISKFDENNLDSYFSPKKFNILYPHWNYENEKYVRRSLQKRAKGFLKDDPIKKLDLIFGHHSHVRQPIVKILDKTIGPSGSNTKFWKVIAYSGGNFTSGVNFLRKKKHIHGKIMKCDIGPLKNNNTQLAVGTVEWKNTFNETVENGDDPTKLVKFGEGLTGIARIYLLIIGGIILALIIILRVLGYL